jgi:hypothetical protein
VAVGATKLASGYLLLEARETDSAARKLEDVSGLVSDMVEFEHFGIIATAVDASRSVEQVSQVDKISPFA